jgi:hypothetical protein
MAEEREQNDPDSPPGHFISEDLREQTAQFLDELRKRLAREKSAPEPKLGPPK